MVPNNSRWRKYRKDSARVVGSKAAAAQFSPLQEAEVGHFLLHLLESPEHLFDHIRKLVIQVSEMTRCFPVANIFDRKGKREQPS